VTWASSQNCPALRCRDIRKIPLLRFLAPRGIVRALGGPTFIPAAATDAIGPTFSLAPISESARRTLYRLAALPAHGNTVLGRDQLVKGLLLSFFDPMARSLRRIEDSSCR
jgi:hypothetical protein